MVRWAEVSKWGYVSVNFLTFTARCKFESKTYHYEKTFKFTILEVICLI